MTKIQNPALKYDGREIGRDQVMSMQTLSQSQSANKLGYMAATKDGMRPPYQGTRIKFDNFDLQQLQKMEALGCVEYRIAGTVSDSDLMNLSSLKNIRTLDLRWSKGFTPLGLRQFRNCQHLRYVALDHSEADDSWAPILATLPADFLSIGHTEISEKGVAILTQSKTLKSLHIEGCKHEKAIFELLNKNWRRKVSTGNSIWYVRKTTTSQ